MTAFDPLFTDPLAVHPVIPPVIARGAEVKARVAGGGDRERSLGAVGVDQGYGAVSESTVVVLELQVLFDRCEAVRRAVRLLLCLATDFQEAIATLLLVHHEQRVR